VIKLLREIIKPSLALFVITAAITLILAITNLLTTDVIAEARDNARLASMADVLPQAATFSDYTLIYHETIYSYAIGFNDNEAAGVVMQVHVRGWAPMTFLVGIDIEGAVAGIAVIAHSETPGLGSRITEEAVRNQFVGATGNVRVLTRGSVGQNEVMAIAGATVTVQVVADGVNDALAYANSNILPNIRNYIAR